MAEKTKSTIFAFGEESTEGTLVQPSSGTQFISVREGATLESANDVIDTDEMVDDIGASEGFVGKETPTASVSKYIKHSGTQGTAPDYALLIKAAMGTQTTNSTEYDTVSSSTAGTSSAAAVLNVDTGEGASFSKGHGVLIKDSTNGYKIRNVKSISSDALTLNYNLNAAPAAGVNLGKAIHFSPASDGHPTFTAHRFQGSSSSAFHDAIAGCRVTQLAMDFTANNLPTITFSIEGVAYYMNPVTVTSSNKYIDFEDDGGNKTATLTEKTYRSPLDLAREVQTKLDAATSGTVTCTYSSTTGKFTITATGLTTFKLEWNAGTNTANSAASILGFSTAADSTGALTYTSTNAATYNPTVTPSPDTSSPNVVKYNELMLGDFTRSTSRKGSNVTLTVATPKTDVEDFSAETGVSGSVILEREATLTATLVLEEHEVSDFDNFVNNTTTQVMFNHGQKSNGNWVQGTCINIYMPNAKVTRNVISESDGLYVVEIECKGFCNASQKDLHINFL
jgi:hypothetical protein